MVHNVKLHGGDKIKTSASSKEKIQNLEKAWKKTENSNKIARRCHVQGLSVRVPSAEMIFLDFQSFLEIFIYFIWILCLFQAFTKILEFFLLFSSYLVCNITLRTIFPHTKWGFPIVRWKTVHPVWHMCESVWVKCECNVMKTSRYHFTGHFL